MTKKIGLTGGIACGKSEVADRLKVHGIPVLDTDQVAHELLEPDSPVFDEICRYFGGGILDDKGRISRRELGKKVFADPQELQVLNSLMHPEVGRRWRRWMEVQQGPVAVVAIPLLFEVGVEKDFDGILCVTAPEDLMIERLKTRNLTEEEAVMRIRSQMPVTLKAQKSNWTFKNNKTLPDLYAQVDHWVNQMIPQEN